VQVRILGPVDVTVNGTPQAVRGLRRKAVLAVLALRAAEIVSTDRLIDVVWADRAPATAANTLQRHVSYLRGVLGVRSAIEARPPGYVLDLGADTTDLHVAQRLIRQGTQSADPATSASHLRAALALWRNRPLVDVAGIGWLDAEAERLVKIQMEAVEALNEARLALSEHVQLVTELEQWCQRHPFHEHLHGQLMRALYRAGRQADALAVYQRLRRTLDDELGINPSSALRELEAAVLRQDTSLDLPGTVITLAPASQELRRRIASELGVDPSKPVGVPVRNDLPGDIADFTGRGTELARLLTGRTSTATVTAVVIEAIDGMAGIGKTTLAVHAAHRLSANYPDAQLFIDLHGHTSEQPPVTPLAALDRLLRALDVPTERIPDDLEARAALWRAELANRATIVVLDNAADAAQVRPLLPGTARSLTLITSRRRLVDLDFVDTLSLDALAPADAVALFGKVVGDDRVANADDAVHEVVRQCGFLPLAIRIAGARLRTRPAWTARDLARRLREARRPLTELAAGDRNVAAAFTLSYRDLSPAQQRMFRLLGVHPGPGFDAPAAAALAGIDPAAAERLLEDLVDSHLLQQPMVGWYRFHDLLRQHANTTAHTDETDTGRREALRRMVDFYLHTGYRGSRLLDQQHPPIELDAPAPGCVPVPLPTDTAAMIWFDDNHTCVLAVRAVAEEQGWDTAVWQLAWILDNFHYRRGHLQDNITSWLAGLAAVERLGDVAAQARAHRRLGLTYAPTGKIDVAIDHLHQSLALATQIGDRLGEAGSHLVLALAWIQHKDDGQALMHATNALVRYREVGNSTWEIRSLSMVGICHARLGRHGQARSYCESALKLCEQHDDRYGQADSLENLGAIASHTGRHADAVRHYRQALALWAELDYSYRQADTLAALGNAHIQLRQHDRARQVWRQAIGLYRTQHRDSLADRTEQFLADLDRPGRT
jgi:DNA-binding SARP family transcriptional activator/tetratricopeptide (TPR) repeat protein